MPDGVVKSFDSSTVPIEVSVQGEVETEAVEYARKRVRTVMDHVGEPVIFVRLRLTVAPDPAREAGPPPIRSPPWPRA